MPETREITVQMARAPKGQFVALYRFLSDLETIFDYDVVPNRDEGAVEERIRDESHAFELIQDGFRKVEADWCRVILSGECAIDNACDPTKDVLEFKPEILQALEDAKRVPELEAQRDKLQAFKDWIHAYLDTHGVPIAPPGQHGAAGCRIGDRMDWLMAEVAKLKAENTALREEGAHEAEIHAMDQVDGLRWKQEAERLGEIVQKGINESVENAPLRLIDDGFSIEHWAVRGIVASLAKTLGDAPNYTETTAIADGKEFVVTVRRKEGKTPNQCRKEAESEVERLRDLLVLCADSLDEYLYPRDATDIAIVGMAKMIRTQLDKVFPPKTPGTTSPIPVTPGP